MDLQRYNFSKLQLYRKNKQVVHLLVETKTGFINICAYVSQFCVSCTIENRYFLD